MKTQPSIHFCSDIAQDLSVWMLQHSHSQIIVLVDENTATECLPIIDLNSNALLSAEIIEIEAGEEHKNIQTCSEIWQTLHELNPDKNALIVAIGGGVLTDIAGFVAANYLRGISYINIPTTLLAQIDASISNKTGINWNHVKNQIGSFYAPEAVFVDPIFLQTLPLRELQAGMAELYKHALIQDGMLWNELKEISIEQSTDIKPAWIERSIQIKTAIVTQDPFEKNIRKALNFGHTIGHAIESYFQTKNATLLHGEAVILGMVAEAYISFKHNLISSDEYQELRQTFISKYPLLFNLNIDQTLIRYLSYDKKRTDTSLNMVLLSGIGSYHLSKDVSENLVKESLLQLTL